MKSNHDRVITVANCQIIYGEVAGMEERSGVLVQTLWILQNWKVHMLNICWQSVRLYL